MPPMGSSNILSIERGPSVVLTMSDTACVTHPVRLCPRVSRLEPTENSRGGADCEVDGWEGFPPAVAHLCRTDVGRLGNGARLTLGLLICERGGAHRSAGNDRGGSIAERLPVAPLPVALPLQQAAMISACESKGPAFFRALGTPWSDLGCLPARDGVDRRQGGGWGGDSHS
jgi:hypothetical protein